jgi:hypothetical protein
LSLHFSVVMAETSRACLGFPSLHHSAMIEDPQQLLGQATFWNGSGWSTKQHKQWRLAYHVRRRSLRNQTDLTFHRKWPIIGRGGERTVRPDEVRGAFSGIVLIGDSVMREVAWGVTQMMNEGRRRERARSDRVLPKCAPSLFSRADIEFRGMDPHPILNLNRRCVPRAYGKYGYTAMCERDSNGSCVFQSSLDRETDAELCARIPGGKIQPASWDGKLAVSDAICGPNVDFFVAYHATWTVGSIAPGSLPDCLRPERQGGPLGWRRHGIWRPVLFIVNGAPNHAILHCTKSRSPNSAGVALAHMSAMQLKSVVWMPMASVSHAMLTRSGLCTQERGRTLAAAEMAMLRSRFVRFWDHDAVLRQFALLSSDLQHFTYAYLPCHHAFPEVAELAAQLALRAALRPHDYAKELWTEPCPIE